ncbi:type II toxin-antitoxin system Phd/YefM family antitoxin [Arthrobacter sp. TE12232]
MTNVGLRELRNNAADLVARAHGGEDIVITNHGVPSVRLVPVDPQSKPCLTKADLLQHPLADPVLRHDLVELVGDTPTISAPSSNGLPSTSRHQRLQGL